MKWKLSDKKKTVNSLKSLNTWMDEWFITEIVLIPHFDKWDLDNSKVSLESREEFEVFGDKLYKIKEMGL